MSDNAKKSKAICVIGMHRSGTSAMARTINMLGAYISEKDDLVGTRFDNPEGFWERKDINQLNEKMLLHFKRSWDALIPLPDRWHLSETARPLEQELAEIIKKNFSDKELWVWKEPRTTLVFELWKKVLKELDIDLVCIYAVRNPLDVARSLEKRDGFSADKSFGIWLNYNLAALKGTADVPRVIISYDMFLSDWEGELKRCALALGIPWPEDDNALKEEMKEFIRPEMRHSFSGLKELKKAGAPRPVIELYDLLMGAVDSQAEPDEAFNRKVEQLSKGFLLYTRFFQEDMMAFGDMTQKIEEQEHRLAQMSRQIANKGLQIAKKDRLLAERGLQIAKKDRLLAEKEARIQALLNSWSWKVTGPMRKTLSLLPGKKG